MAGRQSARALPLPYAESPDRSDSIVAVDKGQSIARFCVKQFFTSSTPPREPSAPRQRTKRRIECMVEWLSAPIKGVTIEVSGFRNGVSVTEDVPLSSMTFSIWLPKKRTKFGLPLTIRIISKSTSSVLAHKSIQFWGDQKILKELVLARLRTHRNYPEYARQLLDADLSPTSKFAKDLASLLKPPARPDEVIQHLQSLADKLGEGQDHTSPAGPGPEPSALSTTRISSPRMQLFGSDGNDTSLDFGALSSLSNGTLRIDDYLDFASSSDFDGIDVLSFPTST